MEQPTRNGRLSILIKLNLLDLKDLTKSLVSISTDHSISDQECQCRESKNALEPTMLPSRDGERMSNNNNGTLMKSPRPSRTTTGSLTHLTSKATEDLQISDVLQLTQDGGNSSNTKMPLSPMRKERLWKFKEMLMLKTETLLSTIKELQSTNNGTLFMQMNGKENQQRVNSIQSSVYLLKDHSILFHRCLQIDTLI